MGQPTETATFRRHGLHIVRSGLSIEPSAICAELDQARKELRNCGAALTGLLEPQGRQGISDINGHLDKLSCNIAVIGQIKAGKSSFLSALIRQPDLLPTHVNPWTTAVTFAHFGAPLTDPVVGARFSFFDRDEWRNIAVGGGQLRELTQRLVPGFDPVLLQHHLEDMRRRTRQRLGGSLDELLGQVHEYATATRDLLDRYVCAGLDRGSDQATEPVFSDIVKRADLFFPSSEPAFPITFVDTPGTNDPFIVRDEITRRALDSADLYIVVLTARDPLSTADLALLRILRGLHREKIVVFINRVDEWDDVAAAAQPVLTHVRARLSTEFPGVDIPIVLGSARWALATMSKDPAVQLSPHDTEKVTAYARSMGLEWRAANAGDGARHPAHDAMLFECSGLPDLHRVLGRLVLGSHAGQVLRQIGRAYLELAHYRHAALTTEVDRLGKDQQTLQSHDLDREDELRRIYTDVEESQRLTNAVHALLIDLQARTRQIVALHAAAIHEETREAVKQSASYECAKLQRALVDRGRRHIWVADVDAVRRVVGDAFVEACRKADDEFAAVEAFLLPKLRALVARHVDVDAQPDTSPFPSMGELPSLTSLTGTIALDLEEPWWRRWWSAREPDDWLTALHDLIMKEFDPIVQNLSASAQRKLEERRTSTLQTATSIFLALVEASQAVSEQRLARMQQLVADRQFQPPVTRSAEVVARIDQVRRQQAQLELTTARLRQLEAALSVAEQPGFSSPASRGLSAQRTPAIS